MTNNFVFIRNCLRFAIQAYPGGKSNQLCVELAAICWLYVFTIVRLAIWPVEFVCVCVCDVSGYYDVLAAKNKRSAHNKSITAPHEGIFAVCVYCQFIKLNFMRFQRENSN